MAEKEYIERNAVVNGIRNTIKKYSDDKSEVNKITASIFQIFAKEFESIPAAADVVEVVRCKDCKYSGTISCPTFNDNPNGKDWQALENDEYCSYGERKEFDNGKN